MAREKRIPIPFVQRWRRFRYTVLPALGFLACVAGTLVLWQRQARLPNAVGEVEAVRLDLAAAVEGTLVPLSRPPWTLFDVIEKDEVVARLDDRPVRAALETLRLDVVALAKQLEATEAGVAWDQADRRFDDRREAARLAWEIERRRLDVLDRRTLVEVDRVELQRRDRRLDFLRPLVRTKAISNQEFFEEELRREEVAKRIEENLKVLDESGRQVDSAEARLKGFAPQTIEVAKLLAPVQAQVAAAQSRVRQVELQVESLEIRSPIHGVISQVYSWPGQHVRAGDPVVAIATDTGRYIVSYLRQEQHIRPTENMPVEVRIRAPGSQPVATTVQCVGPQVELIPEHQRRDPKVVEWGLPVRIAVPKGLAVRPGELIDVTFKTWEGHGDG